MSDIKENTIAIMEKAGKYKKRAKMLFFYFYCTIKNSRMAVAVDYKPSSVFGGHLSSHIVANMVKRYF